MDNLMGKVRFKFIVICDSLSRISRRLRNTSETILSERMNAQEQIWGTS